MPRKQARPAQRSDWQQKVEAARPLLLNLAFWLTVATALAVRFWNLDRLQAEVFGDISTARIYVDDVISGRWPFYIPLSTGPLFHYLVAPITWFTGLNYFALKLGSVLISLAALAFTYLFAQRLLGRAFAITATFIAGVSSWFLIHSRLGNVPIAVPMLAMATLWLLLRYIQEHRSRDLYWCVAVSCLGLYTYAASYVLPGALVLTLLALHFTGFRLRASVWLRIAAILIFLSMPFAGIVSQNSIGFTSAGYLGGKLDFSLHGLTQLLRNVVGSFGAYHLSGDTISRVNPLHRPHLDPVSGVLFLLGIWFWLQRPRRREGLLILISFVLLHLPSMLVISNSQEVPSSTRTVGAAPLAAVLAASGLWPLAAWLRPRLGKVASVSISLLFVAMIATLNLSNYFISYIHNLPYENTPIARFITDYFDLLPDDTQVYLVGCCWEASMPEPEGMSAEMKHPENFHYIQPADLRCEGIEAVLSAPAVLVWNYRNELPAESLAACAERFPAQLFVNPSNGLPMFQAASVQGLRSLGATGELAAQWIEMKGQLVLVRYSALDSGRIEDALDSNPESLMRGLSANPFVLEFEFEEPLSLQQLRITTAAALQFAIRVKLTLADGSTQRIENKYADLGSDPTISIALPAEPLSAIHIEIEDLGLEPAEGYHIHIREISLK